MIRNLKVLSEFLYLNFVPFLYHLFIRKAASAICSQEENTKDIRGMGITFKNFWI